MLAAGKEPHMKLGLVTYQIAKDWDLPTILERLEAAGLAGVELRTEHAHGVEPELSSDRRAEVRRLFADSPVELVGLGSTCEYHSPDPEELQRNIERTRQFVDLAADVGAGGVKVRPNAFPEGVDEQQTLTQIGRSLRTCGEYAAGRGVQIRLEVHGRGTKEPAHIRTILDVCDHPNVWACWNSNASEVADGTVEPNFRLLAGRIGLVHVRDLWSEDYPWAELFGLLGESGYEGFVLIEGAATDEPMENLRRQKQLWEQYRRQ
jgi:sugar phosphate isomerase/epimerase